MDFFSSLLHSHGRIARAAWFYRLVLISAIGAAFGMLSQYLAGEAGAASIALVIVWMVAVVSIQRLHDVGRSGWTLLFFLIPVAGPLFLLFLLFRKGGEGANRYGDDPLSRRGYLIVDITR
jgi:uncharacterized membrane protein YhaH (DUF805 family)